MNRGQHAPAGGSGGGGGGGGTGGSNIDASLDVHGTGGNGGASVCVLGDAGASDASDGDASGGVACNSLMNFENCLLYGAVLNDPDQQLGFKSFSAVSAPTFCGSGALQIDVSLSGDKDAGPVGHGELYIRIPGGPIDLRGKTVTVHVMAIPATSNRINFNLIPVTSVSYAPHSPKLSPIPDQWATASDSFAPADLELADGGVLLVDRFSIQANTGDSYVGKIFIDEIDVTTTPTDGAASDGRTDGAAPDGNQSDVRDAVGDVRDAPSGN